MPWRQHRGRLGPWRTRHWRPWVVPGALAAAWIAYYAALVISGGGFGGSGGTAGLSRPLPLPAPSAALPAPAPGAEATVDALSGAARVVDGDTLKIGGTRIRLYGIDAPESRQTCTRDGAPWPCGRRATAALTERIGGRPVACAARDRDRYGRVVAVCQSGGEDLNGWMVAAGWALAYRRYATDYVGEESDARRHGRGIWEGDFVAPWEWRRGRRS